jgi:hypothetical protein
VWDYARDGHFRLRWFQSEANPGEDGRFHCDHEAHLRESGICGIPHCASGAICLIDGISHIAFLTIRDGSGQVDGVAETSRLHDEYDRLSNQGKKLHYANYYQGRS